MRTKSLKIILLITIIFSLFSINYVQADVGSFETYDSDFRRKFLGFGFSEAVAGIVTIVLLVQEICG